MSQGLFAVERTNDIGRRCGDTGAMPPPEPMLDETGQTVRDQTLSMPLAGAEGRGNSGSHGEEKVDMETTGRTTRRALLLVATLAVVSPLSSAYYYYTFFAGATSPFAPLPAHYDGNAIKDNTVQYFISDLPPGATRLPGDSVTAIYSEIRQAAAVWDGVSSSSLRLHFGGTRNISIPQTVPGIDVVFDDDMPPGIVAQTKLTFPADLTFLGAKGTTFVPIQHAKLQLRSDLTAAGYQQPSYADAFFMTLVHEFGHSTGASAHPDFSRDVHRDYAGNHSWRAVGGG